MFDNNIYVVDLETTGTLERTEPTRITSIGVVKIDKDSLNITETFSTLVNPEEPLTDFIVKYTGLTDEILQNSPTFKDIADQFTNFITKDGPHTLAAWPVSFDIPIIQYEYAKAGIKFPLERRSIDIGTLATYHMFNYGIELKLAPYSETKKLAYSLNNISYSIGIEMEANEKRHDAVDDATLEARILMHVLKKRLRPQKTTVNRSIRNPFSNVEILDVH